MISENNFIIYKRWAESFTIDPKKILWLHDFFSTDGQDQLSSLYMMLNEVFNEDK